MSARNSLNDVRQPIPSARGLPNAHYVDPELYTAERDALVFKEWAGLGVTADVPEPGDAIPVDFMGLPLLLIRDMSGAVRVFQNVCRHRGMILVDAPRRIEGAIRCPYHSWCYRSDGKLVSTPHVGGPGQNMADGIDRDALGLIEVRSHIWMDVVWINVSATTPPPFESSECRPPCALARLRQTPVSRGQALRLPSIATGSLPLKTIAKATTCPGSIRG